MTRISVLSSEVVDNAHTMAPDSPGYAAQDALVMTVSQPSNDGWHEYRISVAEHFGTHVDAPSHLGTPGALTIDRISPYNLVGPAVIVDVRAQVEMDDDYELTVDDLHTWEKRYGAVEPGSVVVMFSGWHTRWSDPAAYKNVHDGTYHFPGFSAAAVRWLLAHREINGVGVDTLSADPGRSTEFPVHRLVLGAGKWLVENLTNLNKTPPSNGLMVVAPTKHRGGSGGPARVFTFYDRG